MPRSREARLTGRYTTNRDGGLTYSYEGSWFVAGDRIVWRAQVRREGRAKGAPHGEIPTDESFREDHALDMVRELITTAIEYRVQVEK